ncbi:MAG TPA: hypothetical protein VF510_22240, partial [Ktedonobacterales bacterium]
IGFLNGAARGHLHVLPESLPESLPGHGGRLKPRLKALHAAKSACADLSQAKRHACWWQTGCCPWHVLHVSDLAVFAGDIAGIVADLAAKRLPLQQVKHVAVFAAWKRCVIGKGRE